MSAGITFRLARGGVAALFLVGACSKGGDASARHDTVASSQAANAAPPACTTGTADLTLPAGFCASVFADSIMHARHVAVASNGDVYVTIEGTQPSTEKKISGADKNAPTPASFVALRDTNHDGRADVIKRVGSIGNTGVGIANGFLYVDEGKQIVRYARSDTALVPEGKREIVVADIPLNGGHRARNFAIGSDGALYLNVGSATNSCQQKDRANESKGVDPCTELETRAGIWKYDSKTPNQKFSPKERFASGIRNGMGIAFGPDGKLYATQHGRDQLHDNWPKLFPTTKYQAENPAEELLQVNQGDDFGWPYCYYSVDEKKLVDAPEYGGDGKKTDRCTSKKAPVAVFPGHWAPMSLLFYSGSALPARYKNGAFIAFHGSWNRAPDPQAGYRVVFQPLANGATSGDYETFANGFAAVPDSQLQPGTAKHRPTGLAQGPEGSLFVTDDMGGRIYRITYGSGSANAPATSASTTPSTAPAASSPAPAPGATAGADTARSGAANKQ
ncbi:MAG: PQQ-dependent sugar dehydrogenase [Gemmatimonadetes bacterium]|nr:PQQ-dependent sugar dehydrogenase [Gemmatimonadota bacterium]